MVRTRKFTMVAVCAMLLLSLTAGATAATAGPQVSAGVRATAMGGAYTALSNDVSALIYNPAGIGQRSLDVTVGGSSPDPENLQQIAILANDTTTSVDLNDLPESLNISGMAGASVGPFAVAGVVQGDYHVLTVADTKYIDATLYKEAIGGLGLRIAKVPLGAGELRIGAAAHAFQATKASYILVGDNYSEYQVNGNGYYLSVGALAKITRWVTLGASAKNLAYNVEWEDKREADIPDPVYNFGGSLKLPILGMTLVAETDTENTVRYGAETNWIFNLISLRAGQIKAKDAETVTTGGFSLNLGPISAGVAAESVDKENLDRVTAEASFRF